ncbi:MAG: hypothetical protein AMXMBFR47_08240 [Planctomycetota bacterium]
MTTAYGETLRAEDVAAAIAGDRKLIRVDASELVAKGSPLRTPILNGLLRRGETLNIVGGPKSHKSWLALDLLLAVATGRSWLGFQTNRGRVLLIDNELHIETLQDRIRRVAGARGIPTADYAGRFDVVSLRGRLCTVDELGGPFEEWADEDYSLVVLDALYRLFRGNENDNADMANVYNAIDSYAASMNSAFGVVHHSSKGNQADKATTDIGAGAGAQSRACDSHLVIRPHAEDGCAAIDAVVRSFAPPERFVIRWQYPVWNLDEGLDPSELFRPGRRQPKSLDELLPKFVSECYTVEPRDRLAVEHRAKAAGFTTRETRQLMNKALAEGLVRFETLLRGKLVYRLDLEAVNAPNSQV